jgi:hypothetical protein
MKYSARILLFVCCFIVAGDATACNCKDSYSFEEQFEESDKIFTGTVTRIVKAKEEFWPPWMNNTFTRITIQVDQFWKGSVSKEETIEWHSYCRWHLKVGEEMLFFVNSGFPHDRAGCGLSNRVIGAQDIIDALGRGSTEFSRDGTAYYVCGLLLFLAVSGFLSNAINLRKTNRMSDMFFLRVLRALRGKR